MKRLFFSSARIFVILSCFVLDVRVRAAQEHHAPSGGITILQKHGQVDVDVQKTFTDVETFRNSSVSLQIQDVKLTFNSNTFATIENEVCTLHYGWTFVDSNDLGMRLKTKHLEAKLKPKTTVLIDTQRHKTTVQVLMGEVEISDRLGESTLIKAGYKLWYGGILASGKKARGTLETIDLDLAQDAMKRFAGIKEADLNVALDHLRSHFAAAVAEVSRLNQEEVTSAIKKYDEWRAENRKRALASVKEKSELKERFRAHALDLPYRDE